MTKKGLHKYKILITMEFLFNNTVNEKIFVLNSGFH
jgi:hypothetical protein